MLDSDKILKQWTVKQIKKLTKPLFPKLKNFAGVVTPLSKMFSITYMFFE